MSMQEARPLEPLDGMMADVARELLGEPAKVAGDRWRYGSHGSMEIDVVEGWFSDHEKKADGGVLKLIQHVGAARDTAGALSWLEAKGIKKKQQSESRFYEYADEHGEVLFKVERRARNGSKTFVQHGPDGRGGFVCRTGCMQGVRRVPYRLPELVGADLSSPVFVCEGEKDVDRLARAGLVATTNPGGAGKFLAEFAPYFADRRVVVLEDNDQAGRDHAADVRAKLQRFAAVVSILSLPGLREKGDVSDWLDAGGTIEDLIARAERALAEPATAEQQRDEPCHSQVRTDAHLPSIKIIAGELHNLATEGESSLLVADAPFFVRGGLVQPVLDEVPASHGRRAKVARLKPVSVNTLVDYMSRAACWQKWNARKREWVSADPPTQVAAVLLSRDGEWRFRPLAGVITTPTLRPDGTILSEPGYDERTQLLLRDPPKLPPIPLRPTRDQALAAASMLDSLFDEFPFVDAASRAAALAGIITPVVRGAMDVAPMLVTTAPAPGSGKSFLIDVCAAPATGERAPVITAGKSEEETEKRLGAALLSGQPIVSIDNVNGDLGGDALCQLIERPVVQVRPLGASQLIKIASRATTYATGNNIRLVADMTRRVIVCSLDPNMERPELREFRADPLASVLSNRGEYVAAALTVSRAYAVAGFPDELRPLASFEQWSRFVRSALVWLGYADPVETMNKARADDPVAASLLTLLHAWHEVAGSAPLRTGEVVNLAEARDPVTQAWRHVELRDALVETAGDPKGGISSRRLGHFLGRHKGRIVDGLKLSEAGDDTHNGQKLWKVAAA